MPQAEALDRMLAEKGCRSTPSSNSRWTKASCLSRIEKRIAEMTARGEALRADDNAEALEKRLDAYRAQTAPLIGYYAGRACSRPIDGMAPIEKVDGCHRDGCSMAIPRGSCQYIGAASVLRSAAARKAAARRSRVRDAHGPQRDARPARQCASPCESPARRDNAIPAAGGHQGSPDRQSLVEDREGHIQDGSKVNRHCQ